MRTAAGSFSFKEMYDRNIEIPSLIDWLDLQGKQHWNDGEEEKNSMENRTTRHLH